MKVLVTMMAAMCVAFTLPACETSEKEQTIPETPQEQGGSENNHSTEENEMATKMKITVNGRTLTATLEDNATTRAFIEQLPMTLSMMDLYGREMCYRFPQALPTDNAFVQGYEVGDIVYYPPMHSFVIMYKQNGERFQMQSIGRIESGVEIFDGIGDVEVRFEEAE